LSGISRRRSLVSIDENRNHISDNGSFTRGGNASFDSISHCVCGNVLNVTRPNPQTNLAWESFR
jgi:hypothetical protein